MAAFHPFPRLPKELQDIIWDKAACVRTDSREVHFFTVFNSVYKHESRRLNEFKVLAPSRRSCLAAPSCGGNMSWTEGNRSMYLLDRGMWTACKASRATLEMKCGTVPCSQSCEGCVSCEYSSDEGTDVEDEYGELRREAVNMRFVADGETQEISVFPRSDLFVLQPYNIHSLAVSKIRLEHTPLFPRYGAQYLHNVAFELPRDENFSIDSAQDYPLVRFLRSSLSNPEQWRFIGGVWFINYRLRKDPAVLKMLQESGSDDEYELYRRKFRGNGCKFIEVHPGDLWKVDGFDGNGHEFIPWLQRTGGIGTEGPPYLGLLAVEEDTENM
ncbi:hypothetical protein FDECE_4141 [Fusarium decemcellulare]|nr:hypothetical protein FDECE_4141 [Fusarium decemcellulare]